MKTQEELFYLIALTQSSGIGSLTAQQLLQTFGEAQAIFQATEKELLLIDGIGKSHVQSILNPKKALEKAEAELRFTEQYDIKALAHTDKNYPKRLKNCPDRPLVLYYKGNIDLNRARTIGIVGTRKPTERGKDTTRRLVQELANYGAVIISGLAYGVDVNAHQKCIDLGSPTIASLAHGLDQIYPHRHRKVAESMLENGGLITEFTSGTAPLQQNFPMRNRIIAGMSDALIVVESAREGGSMISAFFANEYSRDVFAVPGYVGEPMSAGCNWLIKTHRAALLESADDIAYILRWDKNFDEAAQQQAMFIELSDDEKIVVEQLRLAEKVHLDALINATKISTSKMAMILLELEMKGVLRSLPGNNFRLSR